MGSRVEVVYMPSWSTQNLLRIVLVRKFAFCLIQLDIFSSKIEENQNLNLSRLRERKLWLALKASRAIFFVIIVAFHKIISLPATYMPYNAMT